MGDFFTSRTIEITTYILYSILILCIHKWIFADNIILYTTFPLLFKMLLEIIYQNRFQPQSIE